MIDSCGTVHCERVKLWYQGGEDDLWTLFCLYYYCLVFVNVYVVALFCLSYNCLVFAAGLSLGAEYELTVMAYNELGSSNYATIPVIAMTSSELTNHLCCMKDVNLPTVKYLLICDRRSSLAVRQEMLRLAWQNCTFSVNGNNEIM